MNCVKNQRKNHAALALCFHQQGTSLTIVGMLMKETRHGCVLSATESNDIRFYQLFIPDLVVGEKHRTTAVL